MSERTHRPISETQDDDAAVESLLRLSGAREPVPADRMQRLRAAAHADWRQRVRGRRRQRVVAWSVGGLAAAAALVLAVRQTTDVGQGTDAAPIFATVEALSGGARLATSAGGNETVPMQVGDHVPAGHEAFTTGAGAATLHLAGGALLRMDGGTVLRLAAADAVVLTKGAVYIESGGEASLEVRTDIGVVRDIGTKFEVRLTPAGLRVRVREGAVQVRRDRQQHDAHTGDEITLDASGSAIRRTIRVDDDADWTWATGARSPFEIEGRSLREFLDWIAEENGWQLLYADSAVEDKARTTTLHGSIQGLTAEQALAAVLPTSGLEHRLERGVLSIQRGGGAKD
jgi:ferric-dicitrate binding protein FerR (iron transport regulator)